MNTPPTAERLPVEPGEDRSSHELVRDEDVLSLTLQRDLEGIGATVGVLGAIALLLAHVPRGLRAISAIKRPAGASAKVDPHG